MISEALTLVSPTTNHDFTSMAALAAELAAHHGDQYTPAPSVLKRDYGNWYEARLSRTASGRDVGFIAWQRFYASESAERGMEIRSLFVKADVRGLGVGRVLFLGAVHAALEADCQRLRLNVRKDNAVGVQFYKQFGGNVFDRGKSWGYRWSRDGMSALSKRT